MKIDELRDAEPTDVGPGRRRLLALFALVAGLAAVDVASDLYEGLSARHLVLEGGLLVVGLVGVWLIGREVVEARRAQAEAVERSRALAARLEASQAEAERWRAETGQLLAGLGAAIDAQLGRWDLTVAEKEVALLLLKGLSHRELAQVRGISEATARQQAAAVYRKAGLGGRNELAAFFLEDLLLPADQRGG